MCVSSGVVRPLVIVFQVRFEVWLQQGHIESSSLFKGFPSVPLEIVPTESLLEQLMIRCARWSNLTSGVRGSLRLFSAEFFRVSTSNKSITRGEEQVLGDDSL